MITNKYFWLQLRTANWQYYSNFNCLPENQAENQATKEINCVSYRIVYGFILAISEPSNF